MKRTIYSLFLTALFGMLGMHVCAQELSTTEIDGKTYYEIGTADDLAILAQIVNGGEFEANAVLTADIDLSEIISNDDPWVPIGDWGTHSGTSNACYKGHFNGQGHKITGFNSISSQNYFGIFGVVSTGCLIENFEIYGTIVNNVKTAGVVGYARDATPTIRNIHSYLNINNTTDGNRLGGILGSSVNGTIVVDKCVYSGTLDGNDGAGNGNYGGIVGYVNNNANAHLRVTNCKFDGQLVNSSEAPGGCTFGGIVGYVGGNPDVTITNCLSIGTVQSAVTGQFYGAVKHNTCSIVNSFYKGDNINGSESTVTPTTQEVTKVTDEQLASGEVCFMLNGNQEEITWFQTLGTDVSPMPFGTSIVYMNGRQHCNGDPTDETFFSNEDQGGIVRDDHDFVDGLCSYCSTPQEDYMTANAEGFYEIGNERQLVWFAAMVKAGHADLNAVLTDDIEFAMPWTTPIGISDAVTFSGIFDGQGHTLTNFMATCSGEGGLFGNTNKATIKNFNIAGELSVTAGIGSGVVGYPSNSNISDIHSSLVISVPNSGVRHVGGVVGSARGGNTITRCSFSGSMTVAAGSTDNFAGVVAYIGGDSIEFCANYGNITFSDQGCAIGGVAGYLNNTTSYVRNCLNTGQVYCETSDEPKYGGAIIGRIKNNWSNTRVVNNYWLAGSAYGPARKDDGSSPEAASPEGTDSYELASGEICWKLNNESFINTVWRQTLGEDIYPQLQGDRAVVFQTSSGYECLTPNDPTALSTLLNSIIYDETTFLEETIAYQVLLDQYKEIVDSWEDMEDFDEFCASYQASSELKDSINVSASNYEKYIRACEAALEYLTENKVKGEKCDFLKAYLQNEIEAGGEDYPNGSYVYIMENRQLDNDGIIAEIAFVNQMLEAAIADDIAPGKDISRLFANATFANGFEGWTRETQGIGFGYNTSGQMPIVRGLGNGTFNVSQTLTDMPNGIYMITANGMFRSGADVATKFYAGQLYINGTSNYFMSPGEDYVSIDDAEPGVNCLGEGEDASYNIDDEPVGYVPNGMGGCAVAYGAGRYPCFSATEVTDGTLTIGVRSLGTGLASDWMPFGNLHVTFLGTEEEANTSLTDVLNNFKDRAQTIVDFEWTDEDSENDISKNRLFTEWPNISEELKAQLAETIDAVEEANTGEAKMELINSFSELFTQVHAQRRAYIAMYDAAWNLIDLVGDLLSAEMISDEEYDKWNTEVYIAMDHFRDGDVTTEEATDIAQRLRNPDFDLGLPIQNGMFQLASVDDLITFANIVNNGYSGAKAVLTEDIDMTEGEAFQAIGTSEKPFSGEFDGQNHKITNFGRYQVADSEGIPSIIKTVQLSGTGQGFIGYASNATIKNFSIDGAFEYKSGAGYGAIGWAEGSTLINIHSSLKIASVEKSTHIGGICGDMRAGSKAIRCSFSGTITDSHDTHDCIGGIGGYSNENCLYENCANYGTVTFSATNAYAGGICGYVNNDIFVGVLNCLNVGKVQISKGTPQYGGAFVGRLRAHANSKFENNYMLAGSAPNTSGENKITAETVNEEQLASGEVCYKLNGDQEAINWYQTLLVDPYPVLFDTSLVVLYDQTNGYYNENSEIGIKNVYDEQPKFQGIYNLAGQRLEKMQKGINIVNGKKVLVK